MSVIVHGQPGSSLVTNESRFSPRDTRQGAYMERVVGGVLERALADMPGEFHLFNDLAGMNNISGAGLPAMSYGRGNLDHVILGGGGYVIVHTKGTGSGMLVVAGPPPRGLLVRPDGTEKPQPWLDARNAGTYLGLLYRVTGGLGGWNMWAIPDTTLLHPSLANANA